MQVTLRDDDYRRLQEAASEAGTPASTWIRRLVERELLSGREDTVPVLLEVPERLYNLLARDGRRRNTTPAQALLDRVQTALGSTDGWKQAEHVIPVVVWLTEARYEHLARVAKDGTVEDFIVSLLPSP